MRRPSRGRQPSSSHEPVYQVFPCVALEKRPLTPHGFHDASVNPGQIAGWWSRCPDANVAMPTGMASGIDVVDVDVHTAGNGYGAIRSARSSGLLGIPHGW